MHVYQLHAELRGYKPKMWRRFLVVPDTTLEHLGCILMALFHMDGSHPFDFRIPGTRECFVPKIQEDWGEEDASTTEIGQILGVGGKIAFTYDFGDNWEVIIKVEKIIDDPDLGPGDVPKVLKGKGYGIVDDCGGVWGLMRIAEALKDKDSPEYAEYDEWMDLEDLDLDFFDLEEMDYEAKHAPETFTRFF